MLSTPGNNFIGQIQSGRPFDEIIEDFAMSERILIAMDFHLLRDKILEEFKDHPQIKEQFIDVDFGH